MKHGYGTEIMSDGSKYEGMYENNLRSGIGKYSYIDGSTFEGNW